MNKRQYRVLSKEYWDKQKDKDGLIKFTGQRFRQPVIGDWWGDWKLVDNFLELITSPYPNTEPFMVYDIPLLNIETKAGALDWIKQVSEKSWCTESILANLVWALDAIIGLRKLK